MKAKKLTAQEFARAVQIGLGRALLHVKEFGDDGIELIILDAFLINYVYDMQIEGERNYWLMQLVTLTGRVKFYANALLAKLQKKKKYRRYDVVQQIYLSRAFFELGFREFLPVMFTKFRQLPAEGSGSVICGAELVQAGGLAGLEFVAQVLGASKTPDDYARFYILEDAQELFGEELVDVRMKVLSLKDDNIRLFLDASTRFRTWCDKPCLPPYDFTLVELLANIDKDKTRFGTRNFSRFGRKATDDEILTVFNLLLKTRDRRVQLALIAVFTDRAMPLFDARLLELVDSTNREIRGEAAGAFSRFKNAVVRRKALSLLRQGNEEMVPVALELLAHNYKPADASKILAILKSMASIEHIHSAGMKLRTIAENTDGDELAECYLWLYLNGPDSFCRESFLEQLIVRKKCPPQILYESQWDARDETQLLARHQANARHIGASMKSVRSALR